MEPQAEPIRGLPSDDEVRRIADALGPAARLAYAPPHVYPMSAPAFQPRPGAERERPAGGPLGVYVHVPFCNYACNFCFYAKRVGTPRDQMERYVRAVARELEWVPPGTRLGQLYVGGGTPTALPADLLDALLGAVFARAHGGGVHTVECSPESLTPAHLDVVRGRGIGRVSMGVQSLDDAILDEVQRRHHGPDALAACDLLVGSGLTINVDLMYGLPGQTEASFRRDFAAVAGRGVQSVTVYNLRVNERTPIDRLIPAGERLDLARLIRWRAFVSHTAEELGFRQTRWHLFQRGPAGAAPAAGRFEDKTGEGDQFGAGVSARSRLGGTISRNHSDFATYLDRMEAGASPVEEVFPLGEAERRTRFVAQTIGDGKPLDRRAFEHAFGQPFELEHGEALPRLLAAGLVRESGAEIGLTETGKLVHDLVTLAFYPRRVRDWLRAREEDAARRGRLGLNATAAPDGSAAANT